MKPGTLIEVEWEDAYMMPDDEHVDESERPTPAIELSVGYLVRDDREAKECPSLMLAMSMHPKGTAEHISADRSKFYRDRMVIPAGIIRRVSALRKA